MPMVTVHTPDGGACGAYLALPASGTGPGIVIMQEIFGVNQVMRDITDWYAARGFVAICPDLFWRQEPGAQLTDQTEIDLPATVGRRLQIGTCRFASGGETTPCERMDELHPGLRHVLSPHRRGGVWGRVLQGGSLHVGDSVQVL